MSSNQSFGPFRGIILDFHSRMDNTDVFEILKNVCETETFVSADIVKGACTVYFKFPWAVADFICEYKGNPGFVLRLARDQQSKTLTQRCYTS